MIIPAFNAQCTIAATLESVLSQTWVEFEVIVVDDGSTDHTVEIVEQFRRRDQRVRIYSQENAGVAEARNRGIRESRGGWIAPLDADDVWVAECLEHEVQRALNTSERVGVVYSWSTRIDVTGISVSGVSAASVRGHVFPTLLCHNFLGNGSCTLIRRSAFEAVGGYDPRLTLTEDWDLYLRLAERYEFVPVRRFLVRYRQNPSGLSSDQESMAHGQARILSDIQRRNARVPAWLCDLSQSNLYVYFARRSGERGDGVSMERWLRRAAQPIGSPGCGRTGGGCARSADGGNGRRRRLGLRPRRGVPWICYLNSSDPPCSTGCSASLAASMLLERPSARSRLRYCRSSRSADSSTPNPASRIRARAVSAFPRLPRKRSRAAHQSSDGWPIGRI